MILKAIVGALKHMSASSLIRSSDVVSYDGSLIVVYALHCLRDASLKFSRTAVRPLAAARIVCVLIG